MKIPKTTILGVTALLAITTGCSSSSDSPDDGPTISVALSQGTYTNQMEKMLPDFEEASGIDVELNILGLDQLDDQYQVKLNASSTDLDVVLFRPLQQTRLFADNGWLLDLSERVEQTGDDWAWDDFVDSSTGSVTVDDAVYGIPLMTEREILFYNKKMFADAGINPPETMEEVADAARELNDPDNDTFGIVLRGSRASAVPALSGFLYSFGADWTDDARNAAIDSPEAIEAYKYYGNLLNKYGPRGADSVDATQARTIFQNGQAAMYIDADSGAGLLEDPDESQIAGNVGYAKFPTGPAGMHPFDVTSWAAGINTFSENQDASWEFIEWASSSEVLDAAMKNQKSPSPRASSWANSEVSDGFSQELVDIFQAYEGNAVGHDRPLVIEVSRVRDIVGGPLVAAINGEDVEAAAKAANAEFQEYLDTE